MAWLNVSKIQRIAVDINQASITLSHLVNDLVDHNCCEVEQLMDKKQSFKNAYGNVKEQTGISVLKKI